MREMVRACVMAIIAVLQMSQSETFGSPGTSEAKAELSKTELPFWKRKPELQKKIREDRAIFVSVRREDLERDPGLMRFTMLGVGLVARPKDFCFRLGQQYHRLIQISDHFRTVNHDPRTNQLFLITEALGYQARMILKLNPVSEDGRSEIQWEVIWGAFKGMTGIIGFEKDGESKTEVSVMAKYEAKELPIPKVLMGFALEVITQKVAEKMRTYIESQPLTALDAPVPPFVPFVVPIGFLGGGGVPLREPAVSPSYKGPKKEKAKRESSSPSER